MKFKAIKHVAAAKKAEAERERMMSASSRGRSKRSLISNSEESRPTTGQTREKSGSEVDKSEEAESDTSRPVSSK